MFPTLLIALHTFLPAGRYTPCLNEVTKNKEYKIGEKKVIISVGEKSLLVGSCLVEG
jgi:hypothetical protein